MSEPGRHRREFYIKRIAELEERLAAVEADLDSVNEEEKRLGLTKRAEHLLSQIEQMSIQLDQIESENPDRGVRDRIFEKSLQKIDFKGAKAKAEVIKARLNQEGGSVLFFLQRSKKQMGHLCLEEVINVIMREQIIDGRIEGSYRRYPIDLGSAISQYNEIEFLVRLASYFDIQSASSDHSIADALSHQLRTTIRSSIDTGTTIFLEIKGLDDLLELEKFLEWFMQEFWSPLVAEVMAASQEYKSRLIVALIANSQILSDRPSAYFCQDGDFDCCKMLELPLPDWTIEDIYDWLITFRGVLPQIKDQPAPELKRRARRIHQESEGTPESVCVSLREQCL